MMESEMLYNLAVERSYPTPFANSPLLPLLLMSLATQKRTPETKIGFGKEYDFVIVGAGAAGSVLAERLSEVPFINVLLLEAGGDPPLLTEVPINDQSFRNSDVDWNYITTPQKHTAARHINRQILYSAGKVIGGSTIFNNHFAYRGNRKNFDDWAAQGAEGWSYDEVLPYFLKLEDYVAPYYDYVLPNYHGFGGPLTVSRYDQNTMLDENTTRIERAVRKAVLDLGYEEVDADGPTQTGYAKYQSGTRNGQVCSNAKAYLVGCENRENLDIVKNARVTKVVIEGKQATGVIVDYAGFRYEVRARKEVILSAGAISTPQLLMLSGIGPMSELLKFKIPVVADLPVGKNFQDTVAAFLPYYVEGSGPLGDIISSNSSILNYIFNRKGLLTIGFGCFAVANLNKEHCQANLPDFTTFVSYFDGKSSQREFLFAPEFVKKLNGPYEERTTLACVSTLINPKSRGSVRLNSPNPYDSPLLDPNYLDSFEDIETVVQGLKTCLRIMSSSEVQDLGIKPFQTTFDGCEDFVGDEDLYLRCTVRTVVVMLNRFASTAKMGNPLDPTTVVDPQLRVKNVHGLRVVDGSVMPTITWGFTRLAVTMIAEKAADLIKSTIGY